MTAELLTVDELAVSTGMTVRTTRYYTSLGLLPPPLRRGRMAFYGPEHVARLELVRALQDHGFTLAAIERHLAGVPLSATSEELAVHRALLTAWKPAQWEPVSAVDLEARAGRPLHATDLEWLLRAGAVRRRGGPDDPDLEALPLLDLALEALDLELPLEAVLDANAAVRRHMSELADELARVMRDRVVSRYRAGVSEADAERFEKTVHNLRALTLEAIVTSFQRAASHVASTSLAPEPVRSSDPQVGRPDRGTP